MVLRPIRWSCAYSTKSCRSCHTHGAESVLLRVSTTTRTRPIAGCATHAPLYRNQALDFCALVALARRGRRLARLADRTARPKAPCRAHGCAQLFEARPMMIFMDPPRHDRLRKLVSKVFTPRRIGALEPFIRATAVRAARPLVDASAAATSSRTSPRRCRWRSSSPCSACPRPTAISCARGWTCRSTAIATRRHHPGARHRGEDAPDPVLVPAVGELRARPNDGLISGCCSRRGRDRRRRHDSASPTARSSASARCSAPPATRR